MARHQAESVGGCLGTVLGLIAMAIVVGIIQAIGPFTFGAMVAAIAFAGALTGWRGGLATLAACAILLIGIPPSTWLSLAIVTAVAFSAFEKHFASSPGLAITKLMPQPSEELQLLKKSAARKLISLAFKGLKESAIGVAAGFAVLLVVNCVLRGISPDELDLHPIEAGLLYLQVGIGEITSAKVLLPVFVLLVALTVAWPRGKPVNRFVQAKGWVDRLAIPLTVICTFTLYTSEARAAYQGVWALAHREEVVKTVEAIKLWRQAAVAAARVEDHLQHMPGQERAAFSQQYRTIVAAGQPAAEMSRLGIAIGDVSADLEPLPSERSNTAGPDDPTESVVRKAMLWSEKPDSAEPPSRKDLEICKAEAGRAALVYEQAREALIAFMEGQFEFPLENEYIKPFVDSLISSVVKTSMKSIVPESIPNFETARAWWARFRGRSETSRADKWDWAGKSQREQHPGHSDPTPTPELLLAENTSLALVAFKAKYAEAEAAETAHWKSRPGFVSADADYHSAADEPGRVRGGFEPEPRPEPIRIPIE